MRKLFLAVPLILAFICTSCSQEEELQLIQDGAEAAAVAGMFWTALFKAF